MIFISPISSRSYWLAALSPRRPNRFQLQLLGLITRRFESGEDDGWLELFIACFWSAFGSTCNRHGLR
ncbi:hypothetical protein PNOK_0224300 [Pyrrhoderma noxium]|uniref:Uncharacterized protein n=1 Tax=Pyrrhoderma noxium TaxID=2282107 RepID=A0A286URQ8_9AGAM|nr:hypothetical protein PNOK_0224300 [Pyrrhoderma noxium]